MKLVILGGLNFFIVVFGCGVKGLAFLKISHFVRRSGEGVRGMILIFASVSALICLFKMFGCFVLRVSGGVVDC